MTDPTAGQNLPPAPPAYGQNAPYGQAPAYGQQTPPYGQAPAYGQAPGAYGGYPSTPKTNTMAIISLVGGIAGFVWILPLLGSIAGIVLGHMSLNQLKTSGESGRALALWGLILGYVGLGFLVLGAILFFAVFLPLAAAGTWRYGS